MIPGNAMTAVDTFDDNTPDLAKEAQDRANNCRALQQMNRTLFVGNLSPNITEEELQVSTCARSRVPCAHARCLHLHGGDVLRLLCQREDALQVLFSCMGTVLSVRPYGVDRGKMLVVD